MSDDWSMGCAPEIAQARVAAELAAQSVAAAQAIVDPEAVVKQEDAPKVEEPVPQEVKVSTLDLLPDEELLSLLVSHGVTVPAGASREVMVQLLTDNGIAV